MYDTISQVLDQAFIDSSNKPFAYLQHALKKAESRLDGSFAGDLRALLEIRRGVTERKLMGAVNRDVDSTMCADIFKELEALGYSHPVRRWLVVRALMTVKPESLTAISAESVIAELEHELSDAIEQSTEALEELRARKS
jgi:hypothetical protein